MKLVTQDIRMGINYEVSFLYDIIAVTTKSGLEVLVLNQDPGSTRFKSATEVPTCL